MSKFCKLKQELDALVARLDLLKIEDEALLREIADIIANRLAEITSTPASVTSILSTERALPRCRVTVSIDGHEAFIDVELSDIPNVSIDLRAMANQAFAQLRADESKP